MARDIACAMALVTARVEPMCAPMAFSGKFQNLNITSKTTLSSLKERTKRMRFGGTDCALPMRYALKNELDIDLFVIYTDSETWRGGQHPVEALAEYRRKRVTDAKLAVVAIEPNKFSIADPNDPGTLDVVGFDTSTPQVLAEFARGFE